MRKIITVLLLLSMGCYASPINTKYSQKDFTGQSFKNRPASEFSNTTIVGSCFYQPNYTDQAVWTTIFPEGTTNVTFIACNIDNVKLPTNTTLTGELNSHRQFIIVNNQDTEVAQ